MPLHPHTYPEQDPSSQRDWTRMRLAGTDDDSTNTGEYQEQAEPPDQWSRTAQQRIGTHHSLPGSTGHQTHDQAESPPQHRLTERLQRKGPGQAAENKTDKEMPDEEASSAVGTDWSQTARHQTLRNWPSDQ